MCTSIRNGCASNIRKKALEGTSATHPEPSGEVGKVENEVVIGSDVAFAMIEGPSSSLGTGGGLAG